MKPKSEKENEFPEKKPEANFRKTSSKKGNDIDDDDVLRLKMIGKKPMMMKTMILTLKSLIFQNLKSKNLLQKKGKVMKTLIRMNI